MVTSMITKSQQDCNIYICWSCWWMIAYTATVSQRLASLFTMVTAEWSVAPAVREYSRYSSMYPAMSLMMSGSCCQWLICSFGKDEAIPWNNPIENKSRAIMKITYVEFIHIFSSWIEQRGWVSTDLGRSHAMPCHAMPCIPIRLSFSHIEHTNTISWMNCSLILLEEPLS